MKLKLLALLVATVAAQALTVEQVATINKTLRAAPLAELPAVAVKVVRTAKPADRKDTHAAVLSFVAKERPSALPVVSASLPGNRPPVTPGNDHGKRPTVPPGQNDYGRP